MDAALVKKLRMPVGEPILVLNAPTDYIDINALLEGTTVDSHPKQDKYAFVHLFVSSVAELKEWATVAIEASDAILWISYPKKSSKIKTDINRDEGWDTMIEAGLQGVSLISINNTWSAFLFRPIQQKQSQCQTTSELGSKASPANKSEKGELQVPDELKEVLGIHKEANDFFEKLAYTYKKEYIQWITSAKREDTKQKRLMQTIEKLKQGKKGPYVK
ncbi:YdeI/OmpD-associated family protein [Microbacteriaceae bacterium 4G12]